MGQWDYNIGTSLVHLALTSFLYLFILFTTQSQIPISDVILMGVLNEIKLSEGHTAYLKSSFWTASKSNLNALNKSLILRKSCIHLYAPAEWHLSERSVTPYPETRVNLNKNTGWGFRAGKGVGPRSNDTLTHVHVYGRPAWGWLLCTDIAYRYT